MIEIVLDATLLKDAHLLCPPKLARRDARYKVIASLPENEASELDIERSSAMDMADESLSQEEKKYYLKLKDPA
jgi:hypothetical protein